MNETPKVSSTRWGSQKKQQPRRDLTEDAAKKAGYPGALREESGWYRGARVVKRG
jgi:hypothetical protein